MTLRVRLTAMYVAVLAVVLAVFGAATYVAYARADKAAVDDILDARANEIRRSAKIRNGVVALRDLGLAHPGTYVQVVNTSGAPVVRSEALGPVLLPVDGRVRRVAAGEAGAYLVDDQAGGVPIRMMVAPMQDPFGRPLGAIQLAVPLTEVSSALVRLRWVLLLAAMGGLALAAALGWRAAHAALRPVDDIAVAATEIGRTQDLTRRVAAAGEDEVGQLGQAFNDMLDRLQKAREDLERTLEGQRRFLADVSHELRTPLTTMRGNLEITLRDPKLPGPERAEAIADALSEAERMSRLVEDLLALARTGAAHDRPREPVALAPLVRDAVDAARARANGLALTPVIEGGPVVLGSGDQLRRLVDNLIDNAIKYTPQGEVEVTLRPDAAWAILVVRDTGLGMTEEEAAQAFERFWRGDRARGQEGSGLGLAIARAVADEHGGSIDLVSAPGTGSTFTVRLPLVKGSLTSLSDARGTTERDSEEVQP